jgi:glycosyltransferase involved in cell wall biosynthesis
MRIGIDARLVYYRPGGIAEYTRHVIQELAALDSAMDYVVLHHRRQENLAPGPNFQRVNVYTPSHHKLEAWSLSAELARYRLDLLHSPDFIPPKHGARRHVITVHDLHFLHYPQFMTAHSRRFYNDQITWAVKKADHILVDSQATRDDLSTLLNVPPGKMTVHMLGVNDRFHPLPAPVVAETRARLGLPDSYILFVGTFEPRKNIPGLLEAYHILRQDMPGTPPLVMVGRRGWLYEEIFARVEALHLTDNPIWLENTADADMPAIYNGAAVLVLPSHYEGFGLPALEAMACGTPAIVADRSSLPEVVGTAGFLVDPDDPAQITAAIQRVLEDSALREQRRRDGLIHAAQFTWRRTAEIVLNVYQALLD